MKPLSLLGLALAVVVSLSACDPKKPTKKQPAQGPTTSSQPLRSSDPTLSPNSPPNPHDPVAPAPSGPVLPPEPPHPKTVEYAIKIEGKTGYVRSPYDDKNRPIDVRGLPAGTEVEDPYNQGRTLLVP